jgi:hypothetical protein
MKTPANEKDAELVRVIVRACAPGVKAVLHYRGRDHADRYYVHMDVEDDAALHRLCRLAAMVNAPLQVYERSETQFRYTLVVNDWSRDALMSMN